MSNEAIQLPDLRNLRARLNAEQTAAFMNINILDIPVLIRAGLLRPLGRPSPNCVKYFATVELLRLGSDVRWLSRATEATYEHCRKKNAKKEASRARRKKSSGLDTYSTSGGEEGLPGDEPGA